MIAGHPGSFAVRALVLRPDNQKTEEMRMKKILVIQGGGKAKGNNAQLVSSFVAGAEESGHSAEVILLLKNEVKGCMGCNACRYGKPCIQKHAWQFVLDTLDHPTDYPFVCKINQCVGGDNLIIRAGYLRNVSVSIGGTTWMPDMPIESQIKEEMAEIGQIENLTDRALTMMLYLVRKRMFLDGNKRTSMLAGNHVMIANGCGIISVPIELQPIFTGC